MRVAQCRNCCEFERGNCFLPGKEFLLSQSKNVTISLHIVSTDYPGLHLVYIIMCVNLFIGRFICIRLERYSGIGRLNFLCSKGNLYITVTISKFAYFITSQSLPNLNETILLCIQSRVQLYI